MSVILRLHPSFFDCCEAFLVALTAIAAKKLAIHQSKLSSIKYRHLFLFHFLLLPRYYHEQMNKLSPTSLVQSAIPWVDLGHIVISLVLKLFH
mmetsp:Transcript_21408/g.42954  ORF Transcript_21408/g.42954 Transcript_21408/m.42954 type:complete len:93 (-) Transcript_21408:1520-1798(-)